MMAFLDEGIKDLFFLFVRVVAALGGAVAGWMVTGPVVQVLYRVAFHRQMPSWAVSWCKLIGAVLAALLVFWLVHLGGLGGGGGGKGGGTGKGVGPYTNGTGTAQGNPTGKGTGDGSAKGTGNVVKKPLEIEMLGPTTVTGDKGYLLARKEPAVNWQQLKAYIQEHKDEIAAVTIVLTKTSVTEKHPPVQRLVELTRELEIPHLIREE
jgi:hypothetical protein